ncbi:MAG TPA: flagellar M-ring protein FliF [Verrucomicrobiales bacterium]|nr:flagellar M-ring protein FliF [Verrucomicrobiales bacterium]
MKEQLQRLAGQLVGIWKQIGLNQRISLVMAALVVLVALGGVGLWSTRVDYSLLYGRLEDAEASKVVSVLEELKIAHRIVGTQIYVPTDKVHLLRMKLIERGIPRGEGVGYELFDKSNFGISDFLQRANFVRAIQTELARSIVLMDGIESARVFVVIPENRLLLEAQKKPTASVLVQSRGMGPLSKATVNSIRSLVANAVEGLQASQVAVMDSRGNTLVSENEGDAISGLSASQLNVRREYEQHLAKSAESMLEQVLGPGQAVVRVAAEISFDSGKKEDEKYDPEGQVTLKEETKDRKNDTATASGSSSVGPGVPVNTGAETNATANAGAGGGNSSKMAEKTTTKTYGVNRSTSTTVQPPGTLKRLSAAVFVNARMEGEGTARKAVPRTPEELEKLKRIVQSTLGVQIEPGGSRKDELTLEEISFNEQYAADLSKQMRKEQTSQLVFSLLRNLGYPALGLGALLMFFRLLKRTSVEDIPLSVPISELEEIERQNGSTAWSARNRKPEVVTVGVLNQLLKESPENMNMALKNWINRNKPID